MTGGGGEGEGGGGDGDGGGGEGEGGGGGEGEGGGGEGEGGSGMQPSVMGEYAVVLTDGRHLEHASVEQLLPVHTSSCVPSVMQLSLMKQWFSVIGPVRTFCSVPESHRKHGLDGEKSPFARHTASA